MSDAVVNSRLRLRCSTTIQVGAEGAHLVKKALLLSAAIIGPVYVFAQRRPGIWRVGEILRFVPPKGHFLSHPICTLGPMEMEGYPADQVDEVLGNLFAGSSVLDAQICSWLMVADRNQQWLAEGAADPGQWISARFGIPDPRLPSWCESLAASRISLR